MRTNNITHTPEHSLKEILSAWFLMFGLRPVPYGELTESPFFAGDYHFELYDAANFEFIERVAAPDAPLFNYRLTQKALDYIQQEDTP